MSQYWIISYSISFQSDFHIGAGITLVSGNLHGLRLDDDGFPFMPDTQVRGLLRFGGFKLKTWQPAICSTIFTNNFGSPGKTSGNSWSFTSARYKFSPEVAGINSAEDANILIQQSHIQQKNNISKNLFSYQKGGPTDGFNKWHGKIYSLEPASERDVAFLVACMRAEDRIGHRRSRGYGKVKWELESVSFYEPGKKPENHSHSLQDWLKLLMDYKNGESQ
jgi:hypothetical protein